MSSSVEIEVEEKASALYVPLEAVFEKDEQAGVYLVQRGGLREREVAIGSANRDFAVIERGLEKGDRVALRDPSAPPSDFGSLTSP